MRCMEFRTKSNEASLKKYVKEKACKEVGSKKVEVEFRKH